MIKLSVFVGQLATKPDVIAITETKLNKTNYNINFNLTGYVFIHKKTRAVGLGFYTNEELSYSCQDNNINLNLNFVEDMWIKIDAKPYPIVIGVICRHPVNTVDKIKQFGDAVFGIMLDLNLKTAKYLVRGDYNLDLMNIRSKNNPIQKYASNLLGCSCKCLINVLTLITQTSKTLIDLIYTNVSMFRKSTAATHSGMAISDISDHHGTFVNVSLKSAHKKKASSFLFIRDMKNFQLERFTNDLNQNLGDFLIENSDQVDSLFNKFFLFLLQCRQTCTFKASFKKRKTITTKTVVVDSSAEKLLNKKQNVF